MCISMSAGCSSYNFPKTSKGTKNGKQLVGLGSGLDQNGPAVFCNPRDLQFIEQRAVVIRRDSIDQKHQRERACNVRMDLNPLYFSLDASGHVHSNMEKAGGRRMNGTGYVLRQ